ncbi:MAG: aspartate-semialdehyde dehydrogenase [Alphaproteobacteria bacterium]|nr:aspartate-semialdehyde dehydrogenase [Alphaproteobacteria bacterium]
MECFRQLYDKKIAIIGVTGIVGMEMLTILDENKVLKNCNVDGYASENSAGKRVSCKAWLDSIVVKDINTIEFDKYDIVLFATRNEVSKQYVPSALACGCTVIDNSSYFRMNEGVPLVVPEINIDKAKGHRLIANPNCSTIQTVVPLKPLHDELGLKELVISTYQSVSGAGRRGLDYFDEEIHSYIKDKTLFEDKNSPFYTGLLFNLIPQIGDFGELNYTGEEWKMINETKKIFELPNIDVTATCVRVPVFVGHSISVFAKFEKEINSIEKVIAILNNFNGVIVKDEPVPRGYAVPRGYYYDIGSNEDYCKRDEVIVSRIRKHPTIKNGLSFWCVANNIRKGAALNAIQIASLLDY